MKVQKLSKQSRLLSIGVLVTLFLAFPSKIYAQCIDLTVNSGSAMDFGDMLSCIIGRAWTFLTIIFVGVAIIMTMFLVVKMIKARENPKELATIPEQWVYMIIFWFLVAGLGGFALNLMLKTIGLSGIDSIFEQFNTLLRGI